MLENTDQNHSEYGPFSRSVRTQNSENLTTNEAEHVLKFSASLTSTFELKQLVDNPTDTQRFFFIHWLII